MNAVKVYYYYNQPFLIGGSSTLVLDVSDLLSNLVGNLGLVYPSFTVWLQ